MITNQGTVLKIDCGLDGRGTLRIQASKELTAVSFAIYEEEKQVAVNQLRVQGTCVDIPFTIVEPKLWSISTPFLYRVKLTLTYGDSSEEITDSFGIRQISKNTDFLLLNGKPFYVRGYIRGIKAHEHPDTCGLGENMYYRKNILQAKRYGFNFIRFHSTVPPEALFRAADALGMLVHIELREEEDEYNNLEEMVNETEKLISPEYIKGIVDALYNHPSLAVYCIGNEIKGTRVSETIQSIRESVLENDSTRLFLDTTAWGAIGRSWVDLDVQHMSYYFPFGSHADMFQNTENLLVVGDAGGNSLQEQGLNSSICRELTLSVPLIAHEVCHYTALRDFKALKEKFRRYGTPMPWWVDEELKMIEAKGLTESFDEMYLASKLFQHSCWKTAFEAIRRSPLLGGFQFLQFADTDIYENSNGMVDCFDDECFISPEQVKEFNGDRVLLADFPNRLVYAGSELKIPLWLSNFGETEDIKARLEYSLVNREREAVASGGIDCLDVSRGGLYRLATLRIRLPRNLSSQKLILRLSLTGDQGAQSSNHWDLWVFERFQQESYGSFCSYADDYAVITDQIPVALENLRQGKNVCLVYRQDFTRHLLHKTMEHPEFAFKATWNRYKPVIWDRGTNYGGLCQNELLEKYGFCTDRFYGINYSVLTEDCDKMILDDFPVPTESILSGIDKSVRDRFDAYAKCFNLPELQYDRTLRNFSYLFQVKAGAGKLLVCGLNLTGLDRQEPSSVAMAHFIKEYLRSPDFDPKNTLSTEELEVYLRRCAEEPVKERMMTQFWQLDDTPVESTAYWRESREYIDDGTWGLHA